MIEQHEQDQKRPRTIYTFGYTGSTPRALVAHLEETGALLVDIRMSPYSRVPAWGGRSLRERVGPTRYMGLPAFGNVNYKGGPIVLCRPDMGLTALRPVLATRAVILLCACADYRMCHRLTAALYLQAELGGPIVHLPGKSQEPREGVRE